MKKVTIIVCSFMLLLLAACSNVDEATEQLYIEKAEEVVALLQAADFEAVTTQFDAAMASQLTAAQLADITPILEASGHFVDYKKQSVQQSDENYVVVLVAEHANEQRIYTVTYNAADEIAGLFVQ